MNRIASTTRSTSRSSASCTTDRSSVVTFGSRSARRRWNAPRSVGRSIRVSVTSVCGAPSSEPGSNTTKKLGSNRAQSTSRRLATLVGILIPCTSHTISSPTPTPISSASPLSTEIRYPLPPSLPAARGVHQAPAASRSELTSESR